MKEILFVCTGNTCRSPMAQVLLQNEMKSAGFFDRQVVSAGLAALEKSPASVYAQAAVQEIGLSLAQHQARQLSWPMLVAADLVLTMGSRHKMVILDAYPALSGKVWTLAEYAGETGDITDPYGGDLQVYRKCLTALQYYIDCVWKKIKTMEAGK